MNTNQRSEEFLCNAQFDFHQNASSRRTAASMNCLWLAYSCNDWSTERQTTFSASSPKTKEKFSSIRKRKRWNCWSYRHSDPCQELIDLFHHENAYKNETNSNLMMNYFLCLHRDSFHPRIVRISWIIGITFVKFKSIGKQSFNQCFINRETTGLFLKLAFYCFWDILTGIDHTLEI